MLVKSVPRRVAFSSNSKSVTITTVCVSSLQKAKTQRTQEQRVCVDALPVLVRRVRAEVRVEVSNVPEKKIGHLENSKTCLQQFEEITSFFKIITIILIMTIMIDEAQVNKI